MTATDLPGFNANSTAPYADNGIIDLTPPEDEARPKRFRLGPQPDDVFTAAASIPVLISAQFAKAMVELREGVGGELEALEGVVSLFRQVLWPEDADRFIDRCNDIKRPIDHRQLMRIMNRLMTEWGMRSPEASSPSLNGEPPEGDGSNSEATTSPAESTSPGSPPTSSATSPTASSPTGPTPPTSTPPASTSDETA